MSVIDLCSLPAELRNRIYGLVLVRDKPISVSSQSNSNQPALLATCRQIRNEAIRMYYTENTFVYLIKGEIDGIKSRAFCTLLRKYNKFKQANLSAKFANTPIAYVDTQSINEWLHAYHADSQSVASIPQDTNCLAQDSLNIVVRLFGVCAAMKRKPWPQVETILATFYEAIELVEDANHLMMGTGPHEEEFAYSSEMEIEGEDEGNADSDSTSETVEVDREPFIESRDRTIHNGSKGSIGCNNSHGYESNEGRAMDWESERADLEDCPEDSKELD